MLHVSSLLTGVAEALEKHGEKPRNPATATADDPAGGETERGHDGKGWHDNGEVDLPAPIASFSMSSPFSRERAGRNPPLPLSSMPALRGAGEGEARITTTADLVFSAGHPSFDGREEDFQGSNLFLHEQKMLRLLEADALDQTVELDEAPLSPRTVLARRDQGASDLKAAWRFLDAVDDCK